MRFVCNSWILKINPPYLWLLFFRKVFECRVVTMELRLLLFLWKTKFRAFFLRGGSCSWHFWWKSYQLELLTTPKEICWIFVRYKARVAERQDTMQLQVVASQLRSFVLMNAAKDVWEALMKGIKPWFTVWVTLMVGKYPPFQCLKLRSDIFWYLYCLGVINRTFLITVHCRSNMVFSFCFEGPLSLIFRYHCQWWMHRICSLNLWAGPRCWTYLVGSFFQHRAGAGKGGSHKSLRTTWRGSYIATKCTTRENTYCS